MKKTGRKIFVILMIILIVLAMAASSISIIRMPKESGCDPDKAETARVSYVHDLS